MGQVILSKEVCPDTFPPVTLLQILMELLQMPKAETEVSCFRVLSACWLRPCSAERSVGKGSQVPRPCSVCSLPLQHTHHGLNPGRKGCSPPVISCAPSSPVGGKGGTRAPPLQLLFTQIKKVSLSLPSHPGSPAKEMLRKSMLSVAWGSRGERPEHKNIETRLGESQF